MRLNDPLIDSFEFEGVVYPINLSFNRVLDVFDVIADDVLNDFEKAQVAIQILLEREAVPYPLYVDLWLYIKENFIDLADKEEVMLDLHGNPIPKPKKKSREPKSMDFSHDAEFIYASFLQAYKMNLFECHDKLSWVEFKALVNALPDDTIMQRIIEIRQWKPQKGESEEYRANMRKLKNKYRLDDGEEEDDG